MFSNLKIYIGIFIAAVIGVFKYKLVKMERDNAVDDLEEVNEQVEDAKNITVIKDEKVKIDEKIIHSDVDRTRPFGVWDTEDSGGNT